MPIYEFECTDHGCFELTRPMAQMREPAPCPECGELGKRLLSAPKLGDRFGHRPSRGRCQRTQPARAAYRHAGGPAFERRTCQAHGAFGARRLPLGDRPLSLRGPQADKRRYNCVILCGKLCSWSSSE